jgi:hypothetical protein
MPRRKRLSLGRIIFEVLLLYLFSGVMFDLGLITAIVYLFSITMAVFSGLLFKRKYIAWMIIFGTLIGYIAGKFIVLTIDNALAGDIVGAVIVGVVAFSLWSTGRKLRKGR